MKRHNNAQAMVDEHDRMVRERADEAAVKKARSLTNGHAGDPKITGEVLLWLTEEMVEQGRLLRVVVAGQNEFQKIKYCVLNHAGRMGSIALFGQTYKVPLSVAIVVIGFLLFMAGRQQGWM